MYGVQHRPHLVIIGGGITGLTAAYRLCRDAQIRHLPFDITLLEASGRLGGVIATNHHQNRLLDHGPDSFISSKPWGIQLCKELGLEDQIINTTAQHRRSFIVRHGKLIPIPQGFYLMVPGSLRSLITSPILSWRGKLRMACDLVLPRRASTEDESLAHFVTRRLGRETLERLAQPMISGIYTANPEYLSLQATMRQFLEMEARHGSLIRALRHTQRASRRNGTSTQGISGPRYGLFVSFRHGMQTLVDRLAAGLPSGAVRLHTRVCSIQRQTASSRWRIRLQNQPDLEADALCLALPAPQAGRLLTQVDRELSITLQDILYASSAIVNVAYRRADVPHALDGMGFVVPAIEKRTLFACSFSSVKFAGRAPNDQVLLRAFVGGALQPEQYELTDDVMQYAVGQELRQLLGITREPLHTTISRHLQSMPQYHLGHLQRVARIESLVSRLPGLVLAGNAYHGVGIPDCIHSGDNAARTLLASVTASPASHPW